MEKLLTISIAAYNMERYIGQALDSLTDERFIHELEVFVVDDGGTDRTLDIAKEYAEKYPDSIFPVHKENGGYGSTVNYSIAHATGKYFKLLDGDDWFDTEGLFRLTELLKITQADVIVTPVLSGPDQENLHRGGNHGLPVGVLTDISEIHVRDAIGHWGLTYKTDIVRVSGVQLPEHMLYTDLYYSTVPFAVAKTIFCFDTYVYCYRTEREGQSISKESWIRHAQNFMDICEALCVFYEEQKKAGCKNIKYIAHRVARYHIVAVKALLLDKPSKEGLKRLKEYDGRIRNISEEIYEVAGKNWKSGRLLTFFRRTNYRAYWLLSLVPGGFPNSH